MPLYSFHLPDGMIVGPLAFPDDEAVWAETVRLSGEMLRDLRERLTPDADWEVSVTDAAGRPVAALRVIATRHAGRPPAPDGPGLSS
jgi:hypothetical protein